MHLPGPGYLPKVDSEFFRLCFDSYRHELEERDRFVRKHTFLLGGIVLIGGLAAKMSRLDLLPQVFLRSDVLLFYLTELIAFISLGVALLFFMMSVWPRKYQSLNDLRDWIGWRDNYGTSLSQEPVNYTILAIDEAVSSWSRRKMLSRLVDAAEKNFGTNQSRAKLFDWSTYAVLIAVIMLGLHAMFRLWIVCKEVAQ